MTSTIKFAAERTIIAQTLITILTNTRETYVPDLGAADAFDLLLTGAHVLLAQTAQRPATASSIGRAIGAPGCRRGALGSADRARLRGARRRPVFHGRGVQRAAPAPERARQYQGNPGRCQTPHVQLALASSRRCLPRSGSSDNPTGSGLGGNPWRIRPRPHRKCPFCRVSSAVEQRFCKPLVRGSNPLPGTNKINHLRSTALSRVTPWATSWATMRDIRRA